MRVLVIAPHPDDETLGVGGTLLKHKANGDEIFWLIVTGPDPEDWPAALVAQCLAQVKTVSEAYPFVDTVELNFPSTRLDEIPKRSLIDAFNEVIQNIRPQRIYTVGNTDAHTDHMVTFEHVMLCLKPFRQDISVEEIFTYEVLSSTDAGAGWRSVNFVPNYYNNISGYLERKLEIMNLFENQLQSELLPRSNDSIRALARFRGATIGVKYAETFRLIRRISR